MNQLTHAWSLPAGVVGLDVECRWQPSERVGVVVHYLDREGHVLQRYTMRLGSHLWHEVTLPSMRAHCAQNALRCVVREVAGAPASRS